MYARSENSTIGAWAEECDVRRLLRGLHRPHALDDDALAQSLCSVYSVQRPYDAVLELVRETFINKGLIGKRLYELIQLADVEGKTQMETAHAMSLSMRQFFRYRSEAVRALVRHVRSLSLDDSRAITPLQELMRMLLDADPRAVVSSYGGLPQHAKMNWWRVEVLLHAGYPIDDSILDRCGVTERLIALLAVARFCFESGIPQPGAKILNGVSGAICDSNFEVSAELNFHLQLAAYAQARCASDVETCDEYSGILDVVCKGDADLSCAALLIAIESAIRQGHIARAEEIFEAASHAIVPRKDLRLLGMLTYYQALIAYMRNDLEVANSCVNAVIIACRQRPRELLTLQALSGRINCQQGQAWRAVADAPTVERADIHVTMPDNSGAVDLDCAELHSFPSMSFEIVRFRADLLAEFVPKPEAVRDFIRRAEGAGFSTLIAAGYAVLANLFERLGDEESAQGAYLQAWASYASIRDDLLGHDLLIFDAAQSRDLGPLVVDEGFIAVFGDVLASRFPHSILSMLPRLPAVREFWKNAIRSAHSQSDRAGLRWIPAGDLPEPVARSMRRNDAAALIDEVPKRLSVCVPYERRGTFVRVLTELLATFYSMPLGTFHARRD